MRIVGVDPGLTTGLCFYNDGELESMTEARSDVEVADYICACAPDVVVMENYIVGKRPSRPKEPLMMIGAVSYMCQVEGIELVIQGPNILSRMMKMTKGIHKSDHIRSACAHVMYYMNGESEK